MTPLDWVVMALYGAVVLGIGAWAHRRQRTSEDYFLGGRRLRWWVVGVSLVATSFSAVSLIGGTGFGFATGMGWLQLQLGDLVAVVVVCLLFLPFFSRLRLTTAYEYLERRFGGAARTVASALFIGQTLLRASILVLVPAVALAAILGWPVPAAIVVAAAAAIAYSAFGGLGAVVWTDLLQMAVILFAVTYSLALVAGDLPGGLASALDHAREAGRLEVVTVDADRGRLFNLLGACVPYTVFAVSLFGTGQQAVQRFLSCTDLRAARRAALTGWAVGTLALGLTLFLGVCLAAWVDLAPSAVALEGGDRALPDFIAGRLPAGLAGLMLAAVFAASMSSLDSAIHSTSTAILVDFLRRFSRRPPGPRGELAVARLTTGAVGALATLGAIYAAEQGETAILETLVRWLGYFAGPLLGLFLLGLLTRRANEGGALGGVGVSVGAVLAVAWLGSERPWGFHRLWLAPFGCAVTCLVGWPASLGWPAPGPSRLRGLTLGAGRPGAPTGARDRV
ncbi:MAG: sodium:solute symporter family transporter [Planctomycetota bacterium]|jgi:SSS family solute:Na+ symporter